MPNLDKTGPFGKGSGTGRGRGICGSGGGFRGIGRRGRGLCRPTNLDGKNQEEELKSEKEWLEKELRMVNQALTDSKE